MIGTEIVTALRCTSTVQADHPCEKCKYHGLMGCDSDQINFDAANLIERLSAENAALREKQTIRFPKAAIVCSDCRNAFKKDALWSRNCCPNCGARMDGDSA